MALIMPDGWKWVKTKGNGTEMERFLQELASGLQCLIDQLMAKIMEGLSIYTHTFLTYWIMLQLFI